MEEGLDLDADVGRGNDPGLGADDEDATMLGLDTGLLLEGLLGFSLRWLYEFRLGSL